MSVFLSLWVTTWEAVSGDSDNNSSSFTSIAVPTYCGTEYDLSHTWTHSVIILDLLKIGITLAGRQGGDICLTVA